MAVHDIRDKDGRVFAFEVDNLFLSREKVRRIIESIHGVGAISSQKEEVFLKFDVEGRHFEVWEPFGDNSRYWIGPEPAEWCEPIDRVRAAFVDPKKKQPNHTPEPMPLKRHGSS
jgi:hypothetical protein